MISIKSENNLLLPPNLLLWSLSLLFHPNGLESSISLIYEKKNEHVSQSWGQLMCTALFKWYQITCI